jgi:hypothetical protein
MDLYCLVQCLRFSTNPWEKSATGRKSQGGRPAYRSLGLPEKRQIAEVSLFCTPTTIQASGLKSMAPKLLPRHFCFMHAICQGGKLGPPKVLLIVCVS